MELFYCEGCQKWYLNESENKFSMMKSRATEIDPIEYEDKERCAICSYEIEDKNIVDDITKFLDDKGIRI